MYTMQEIIEEVSKVKPELFPFAVWGNESGQRMYIALCKNGYLHATSGIVSDNEKSILFISEDDNLIEGEEHNCATLTDFDAMLDCYIDIKEKHNNDFKKKFNEEIK